MSHRAAAAPHRLSSPAPSGVWRRSASMAAWAAWRSRTPASPGRSRCPERVSLRRWSGRWGRRRASSSRTVQLLLAPPSFRRSWGRPPSSPYSSTSALSRGACPSEEVRTLWANQTKRLHFMQILRAEHG